MVKLGIRILLIAIAYLLVCVLGYLGFVTHRHNNIGWFLILTAVLYAVGGPYLLWSNLRKEPIKHQEHQDRSFWVIIPGFLVVFYSAPLEFIYLPKIFPASYNTWTQIIGWVLITSGILLFFWARLTLKDLYSGRIRVKAEHTLVQNGPYHFIRHPAYAAYILMSLGIIIGYSSMIGLLGILFLLIGLVYRINVEEQLLVNEFGEQYLFYRSHTKRLIPFIW